MSTTGNAHPPSSNEQQFKCLSNQVKRLVRRYCQLASKAHLTEDEEQEFECLLKLAESEAELDFWFNEADHFLAHELGLTSPSSICEVERKQVKLHRSLKVALESFSNPSEEFDSCEIHDNDVESMDTFLAYSHSICREVQSRLKYYGYDIGPEDGDLGKRTQLALRKFQIAKCLIPSGKIDILTQEALGIWH